MVAEGTIQASERYKQPVFICHHDVYEPQEPSACQNNIRGVATLAVANSCLISRSIQKKLEIMLGTGKPATTQG